MTAGNGPGVVFALARGDYLERIRRPAFLVTLAFMIYAAYVFLPPAGSGYLTLDIHGYRPIYNSAGVAALLALLANTFIALAGFYLVRGAVERDRLTGVGPVLAATPLGRLAYLLSKLASGFAVLASMMAMLWLAGAALQLVQAEARNIDPIALAGPLLAFCLPTMLVIASIAVAFDCLPVLRGGFGNVAYFVLWCASLGLTISAGGLSGALGDPYGSNAILTSIIARAGEEYPRVAFGDHDFSFGFHILGAGKRAYPSLIHWNGVHWTWEILAARLMWIGIALLAVAVCAPAFDRFSDVTALDGARARFRRREWGRSSGSRSPEADGPPPKSIAPAAEMPASSGTRALHVHDLTPPRVGSALGPLIVAEWKLLVRPRPLAWKLAALGLAVAGCFVPLGPASAFVVLAAWIWPIFAWSELGMRERRFGTGPVLFSVPRPVLRPLLAAWFAGFAIALLLVAPVAARSVLAGHAAGGAGLVVGAAFIPAMALACGAWTGGSKLFEVLYLLLWYIGPLNHVPTLDYTGNISGTPDPAAVVGFASAALGLLGAAALARLRALAE